LKNSLSKYTFDTAISSPLMRCIQTTKHITDKVQGEFVIDPNLVELNFGLWEGLHYLEVSKKYPKEWDQWVKDWRKAKPTEGESFEEMYKRVKEAITSILANAQVQDQAENQDQAPEHTQNKNIIIVTHKGCLQIIASILLASEDKLFWNFSFEYGKYSLFEINNGHCTIKRLNSN